jgi:hypothetical protein
MINFENVIYISGICTANASNGANTRLNFMASRLKGKKLIVSFERSQLFRSLLRLLTFDIQKRDDNIFILKLPYFPLLWPRLFFIAQLYYNLISLLVNYRVGPQIVQVEMLHFAGVINTKFCSKFVCDIHGDYRSESGFDENTKEYSLISWLNRQAITKSDQLIVVSEKLKNNLHYDYDIISEMKVIPCLPSKEFMACAWLTEIKALDELVLCYVGGIQKYQQINYMLNVIMEISKIQKCRFIFISGSNLSETCRMNGVDYFEFTNCVNFVEYINIENTQIPRLLSYCDYGFLLRENSRLNIEASPTKLREYFSNGIKVITTPFAGDVELFPTDWCSYVELDDPVRTAELLAQSNIPAVKKISLRNEIKGEFHGLQYH